MMDLYFLVEFPIYRDFDADDIECLAGLCEELSYRKGERVFDEDEPGDAMYIVRSGLLEVLRGQGDGAQHINLLNPGEFFGDMALIDGSPRSAGVVVKEDAVLIRFSRDDFRRLKKQFPATALKFLDVLLKTLSFRVRRSTSRALKRAKLDPWADMSAVGSAKVKALAASREEASYENTSGSNLWAEALAQDEAREKLSKAKMRKKVSTSKAQSKPDRKKTKKKLKSPVKKTKKAGKKGRR